MSFYRLFGLSLLLSLVSHALLLWAFTKPDVRPAGAPATKMDLVFSPEQAPKNTPTNPGKAKKVQIARNRVGTPAAETVLALDNADTRYAPYLQRLREKIERLWIYPPEAHTRGEEGQAVVRFSIAGDGRLNACGIDASSGSVALDEGALRTVHAAAPYDALPESWGLSRLHIIAAFQYTLRDASPAASPRISPRTP